MVIIQRYSLYAYDPGDHCLEISKQKDDRYGEWVKYKDIQPLLEKLNQLEKESQNNS